MSIASKLQVGVLSGLDYLQKKSTTHQQLNQIKTHSNPNIKRWFELFDFFIHNRSTWQPQELTTLATVDAFRRALSENKATIQIQDFGAGSAWAIRSEAEMEKGVFFETTVAQMHEQSSSPEKWGLFIFKLLRMVEPMVSLELGTCLGGAAAYQIAAHQLNQKGKLITLEGSTALAKTAKQYLTEFGLAQFDMKVGRFQDTLPNVLKHNEQIDFAFIDGHHDEKATIAYFNQIYPKLSERGVLLFDDINWSMGMRKAWRMIAADDRIEVAFDLFKWGICVVNKSKTVAKDKDNWFSLWLH